MAIRYSVGKNATDSAMIIDAMDILHSDQVEGFCLVSSDSDYTRLATRIRESGLLVVGIGKKNTPRAFVSACNVFIYTENLKRQSQSNGSSSRSKTNHLSEQERELVELVSQAIDMVGTMMKADRLRVGKPSSDRSGSTRVLLVTASSASWLRQRSHLHSSQWRHH